MSYKEVIFSWLFCLGINYTSIAQSKLDSLYALASEQSFGAILVPQQDFVILIGHGTNNNPFNSYGTLFTKIGLDGTILFSSFTLDTNKFRQYYNLNAVVLDTTLYITFNGSRPYQLLKFNINTGEIGYRKNLDNQLIQDGYYYNYSLDLIDSQTLLINSTVLSTANKLVTQLAVYHIQGDSLTYHYNSNSNFDQIITKAINTSDGYLLSGYVRFLDQNNDYLYRATVVWTDDQFVEKKRYLSSSDRLEGLGYDVVIKENKYIVATNCIGQQMNIGFGNVIPVWRPSIYCVDSLGQLVWQTEMGYRHFGELECIFNALIPSNSNDGYIAAGAQTNFSANDYYFGDTTNANGEKFRFDALIAKVSGDGDSLWSRHYYTSDFLFSNAIIFDIIPNPEGGYFLTGWANKHKLVTGKPANYTWILSIDEFGCIVPGCHLISSTESSPERNELLNSPMKIYPNPASGFINVLITTSLPESATIHLNNSLGQEVDSWHSFETGATYIIPVDHLAPGVYFMVMTDGNAVISSQQILVR